MHKFDLKYLAKELGLVAGNEIERAIKKHGLQDDITPEMQYVITAEEFGEIAKGIIEKDNENVKEEIVQTMAMLVKLYALL